MFSLQVTMFIICSHISFLVSVSVSSCPVYLYVLFSLQSLFSFFSKRRNSSLKEEKHVRAQGNPQTSLLLLLYLIHSLSILYIHCFCFPLLLSSCACVRGGVLPLRGFLCFWPIVPPLFSSSSLMGPSSLLTAPKFCQQTLTFAFPLCLSVFPQITSLVPSL